MRRFQFCVFACMLFLPSFVFTVSAHPGKTDSQGGHYDWSTGEYHYHHGYSAHDHYDMDGDGIVDCPYNFNDRTGYSSSSNYSSTSDNDGYLTSVSSYNEGYNDGYDTGYEDGYADGDESGYEEGHSSGYEEGFQQASDKKVPRWMLFLSLAILGILILVNRSLRSDIKELKKNQVKATEDLGEKENTIKKLTEEVEVAKRAVDNAQKKMRAVQTKADAMIKASNLPIINVPDGVFFSEDGIPICGESTAQKPYGDYTAFISERGKVYHLEPNCGKLQSLQTIHLFEVLEKRQPCARCGLKSGIPVKVPKWYKDICEIRFRKY